MLRPITRTLSFFTEWAAGVIRQPMLILLPVGEDRFEVLMEHFARAYTLVGEDLDRRELAEAMQPLVVQLTVDELRELAEQARETRP